MSANPKATTANLISCMSYRDPAAAIDWLEKAFGFAPHGVYKDDKGRVVHAELSFGNGMIMIGPGDKGEFGKRYMTTPEAAGGKVTQSVYVIVDDVDAHHARAAAAGAEIVMPLEKKDYGGSGYSARDPGGHLWSFGDYDPWAHKGA